MTNADGYYSWSLPAATYTLTAICSDSSGKVTDIDVTDGATTTANITVDH